MFTEPTKFPASKGCFVARTLVNPTDENAVLSVVNLSDQAVKINQNSVLGKLEDTESIFCNDSNLHESLPCNPQIPEHLKVLLEKNIFKIIIW